MIANDKCECPYACVMCAHGGSSGHVAYLSLLTTCYLLSYLIIAYFSLTLLTRTSQGCYLYGVHALYGRMG